MEPTGNGIGGDLFAIVWDPKTKKLYGYNGSGRSPKSLTLDEFQKQRPHRHPAARPAAGQRAGRGRRLVRAARPLRQAPMKRRPRAGDPLRARRPSGARDHRLLLGPCRCRACRNSRASPNSSRVDGTRAAQAARSGRTRTSPTRSRRSPQGGRDAFYKGDIARTIDAYFKANGGFLSLRGPRRAPRRMGRAGQHQLPRLRRLGTAAQRPGHRRAADAQPARRLRLSKSPASAAPSTCTCSSKPRSSPSPTARAATPIRHFSKAPVDEADLQGRTPQQRRKLISIDKAAAAKCEPGTPPNSTKATRST